MHDYVFENFDQALADCNEAIKLGMTGPQVRHNRGFALKGLERWQEALADYDRAILLDAKGPDIWLERAEVHDGLQRWQHTVDDCTQAIKLGAQGPLAWLHRGAAHANLEQWDQAIADFTRAIDLKAEGAEPWRQRGHAYVEKEEWEKALADFNKAIALDPKEAGTFTGRGDVHLALGNTSQAIADYTRAIELKAEGGYVFHKRGDAYAQLKQWDKANADYTKAVELKEEGAAVWQSRGRARAELGEWDKAGADLNEAHRLDPDNASIQGAQARVRLHEGDLAGYRKVCADLLARLASKADADTANEIAWTCVLIDQAVPNPQLAVQLAEKALTMEPKSSYYLGTLGSALYRAGQFGKAVDRLNDSIKEEGKGGSPSEWLFCAGPSEAWPQGRSEKMACQERPGHRAGQISRLADPLGMAYPAAGSGGGAGEVVACSNRVSPASLSALACCSQTVDSSTDNLRLKLVQNLSTRAVCKEYLMVTRRSEGVEDFRCQWPSLAHSFLQFLRICQNKVKLLPGGHRKARSREESGLEQVPLGIDTVRSANHLK